MTAPPVSISVSSFFKNVGQQNLTYFTGLYML
jgi:hypothetical protein